MEEDIKGDVTDLFVDLFGRSVLRFKHLSWPPGVQLTQGRPFRAQKQFLQRPLLLQRQHLSSIPPKLQSVAQATKNVLYDKLHRTRSSKNRCYPCQRRRLLRRRRRLLLLLLLQQILLKFTQTLTNEYTTKIKDKTWRSHPKHNTKKVFY